jgi:hypothetical protein
MKKVMSKHALAKETAFWTSMKLLAKKNSGTVCRK